jgi:CBS domain-containing protein
MTGRLLQLGIERSGEAPAAWAWIALGSAARREQALATDQDHAIALGALDSDPAQVDAYFATLAEFVTGGLEAAGIPRCRGDAMAVHPTMRASLDEWVGRFHRWMDDPSFEGSIMSSIGFDFRTVAGSLDADRPLATAFRDGRTRPRFVRLMARRALSLRPPTGFFRHLVVEARGEHAGRLDVKHGGITIVNNLARAWAIQSGVTQIPTLARLDAVAEAGVVERDLASEIAQAFHFLWDVRLRHQVAQLAAGEPPDDFVDPGALGAVARAGLKEAFRAIGRGQRQLAADLGIEMR